MEELNEYYSSLATTLWGLMTINQQQEVKMTLTNAVGDEIFISAFFAGNGANVRLEYFSDGLLLKEEVLKGGSFQALEEFLKNALDVENNNQNDTNIGSTVVMTFAEFIGDTTNTKEIFGAQISDFENFILDQEVEQILMEDPTIAMHE
tara:strand:+ start:8754 stop:9200 length:447 start_codon:yes stop_codon:yes gene_type:complete